MLMYEEFYELSGTPFAKGIPTDKLFKSTEFTEVSNRLSYVSKRHLFAVLTGECGTGKSTLLRYMSETLDSRKYHLLYVSDSKLTPNNFYRLLLEQLGVAPSWNKATAKRQLAASALSKETHVPLCASSVPVAPPLAENGTFVTFPFFAGFADHKNHNFLSFNSSTVISPILLTPFFLILLLFI